MRQIKKKNQQNQRIIIVEFDDKKFFIQFLIQFFIQIALKKQTKKIIVHVQDSDKKIRQKKKKLND